MSDANGSEGAEKAHHDLEMDISDLVLRWESEIFPLFWADALAIFEELHEVRAIKHEFDHRFLSAIL